MAAPLPASNNARALRTTQIGIVSSILLIVIKAVAGNLGHSYALIADATESGADVLSSGLLWVGLRFAMKPADDDHPYGHGKAEPMAAILISIFLLGAAAWIGTHAWSRIRTPHEMPLPFTLLVLLFVIGVKEGLYRYVIRVGRQLRSQAVIADAQHHRSDVVSSVAAFAGISFALLMGKGYETADDWAALVAAVIIAWNAIQLVRPALGEIMDVAPSPETADEVRQSAAGVRGVRAVEQCHVRKMGFDYFVDLHILVDAQLTVDEGHRIAHNVKDAVMQHNGSIRDALIHVEPFYEVCEVPSR